MTSGRPSAYKEEYCQDIIDYFESHREMNPPRCPLFEMYAKKIGVHRETLINWAKKHPIFFDAYEQSRDIQRDIMINNAMLGVYNASFTKFAMSNMHGWSDVSKQEISNPDGSLTKKLSDEDIDRIIQARLKKKDAE